MQARLPRRLASATAITLAALVIPATAQAHLGARRGAGLAVGATRIRHIIEIMIENHTFDSLFGHFPGADGIPAGTTLPNPHAGGPPVHPVLATPNEGDVYGGIDNSRATELSAMDYQRGTGYLMDRYTVIPQDGLAAITGFGPAFDPDQQYLARHYELADQNFQPTVAPTQPNVMMALNGTDHGWPYNTPPPSRPWHSIFDELTAHNLSWKIYYALPPAVLSGTLWDQIIPPEHAADLTTGTRFFTDLATGHLPDFSFVRPGVDYSTEPPEDVGQADAWIGQLVGAVARSRYWDSSAIFITWDEGGGFWDHVPPPPGTGYGTRTPMIIVSPWARHQVFSQRTTNVSILSFVQHLWDLPPLTRLNARQNDLAGAFSFNQAPLRAPRVPDDPAATIGFHGTGGIVTDIKVTAPGHALGMGVDAETRGLTVDSAVSGTVRLTVTPPPGVPAPAGVPASVTLADGTCSFTATFARAGFYRIAATGPGGIPGWVTVDVGTGPDTAPPQ